jgi:hypothetical protein
MFDRFRQPSTVQMLPGVGVWPRRRRLHKTRLTAKYTFRTTRFMVRHGFRHRHPLAPLYATVVLLIAGFAGRLVTGVAVFDATAWAFVAVLLLLWQRRRADRKRPLPQWQIIQSWSQMGAAGLWLLLVILAGGVPAARVGIVAWGIAAGVGWGLAHYRPKKEKSEDDVDPRVRIWLDDVAAQGGLAPGTELMRLTADVNGDWDAVWVDPRGKRTTTQLIQMQDNLGALFGATAGGFVVEPPTGGLLREARIMKRTNNPVNAKVEMGDSWLVIQGGSVPLTVYPDAERGWFCLYVPESGTVAAIFSGDTGAGKSVGMGAAITASAHTGLVLPFVGDPKKNSFPQWSGPEGHARWTANCLPEARRQARAMRRLVYSRQTRLMKFKWTDKFGDRQVGINFFDPAYIPWPIYEFSWDEAQIWMKDPEIAEIFDETATLWRALGIRAQVGLPYPIADELGGSVKIRQAFNAGNTVAFRNNVKSASGLILPDWMPNPADIPLQVGGQLTKGQCVLYSVAPNSQRPTFSRVVYAERAAYWAKRAAARIPEEHPDDLAALNGANDVYGTWRQRRDRGEDAIEDVTPTVIDLAPTTTPADGSTPVAPAQRTAPQYVGGVEDRIRQYFATNTPATSGTVAFAINMHNGSVSRAFRQMREAGQLLGQPHGCHRLPGQPDLDELPELDEKELVSV